MPQLASNLPLHETDHEIFDAITKEQKRQEEYLELIASENHVSKALLAAQGSVLTNKYAEGYPGKRYYGGCEHVDSVEKLAIERLKKLFGCEFANVQPHSGSQANQAVFLALLQPGDTILGMSLDCGGHLTHGSPVNISGKWFNIIGYGVDRQTDLIDYDEVRKLALENKPKLIIAGGSAYPQKIDFAKFREIADEVGATLLADVAHYSGLIVTGQYPNPFPYAHIATSTTHKTLRAARGGIIMTNDAALAKKLNSAIFPGLQGGPLMQQIAAKAVGFGEALKPEFTEYAKNVIKNAKAMAEVLKENNIKLVTNGTECHMLVIDLRPNKISGKVACEALEEAHITTNKNGVPYDNQPPTITSGLRIGSQAITTRGASEADCRLVAQWMADIIHAIQSGEEAEMIAKVRANVLDMCARCPLPH